MNKGELALAVVGTTLQIALLLQLLKLQSYRRFPTFFVYVAFSVASAILSVATSGLGTVYFYVYWISEAVYVLLAFLVLQEAFRSVFRNFYRLRWFRMAFPVIGILMLAVALFRYAILQPTDHNPVTGALISLEIAVGFLQLGIFCLFIVLVWLFHMQWRQYGFGIVLGFGISAAGTLIAFLLRSEFGTNLNQMVRIATPLSYIIGVAIWLATFLRGEPSQPEAKVDVAFTPEQMLFEVRRYTRAVKGMLGR
jgi:hypothetical protein